MVKRVYICEQEDYVCEECGLVYHSLETALRCEDYCRKHNACSLTITKNAAHAPQAP
ncbi:MAG: hypothetical protein QXJ88_05485 [Nitrososphaerota archaeon]